MFTMKKGSEKEHRQDKARSQSHAVFGRASLQVRRNASRQPNDEALDVDAWMERAERFGQSVVQLRSMADTQLIRREAETPRNETGMPDGVKEGLEQLSGLDLSGVRVHYNSARPAQLGAHAYAQGQNIHLGPGQEQHLPHEGWHVVQQMNGRVKPTGQVQGQLLNDDGGLEQEASVMGGRALQMQPSDSFKLPDIYANRPTARGWPLQLVRNRRRWTPAQREQSRKFWEKKRAKERRESYSKFMRENVFMPDEEKMNRELSLDIKGPFPLDVQVVSVILQGSTIASQHQDLICPLKNGNNLRFSRNNAADTAQYGADRGRAKEIASFTPKEGTTVKAALRAFRSAHDALRLYDHGDCQVFAAHIVKEMTGHETGFGGDDDFM